MKVRQDTPVGCLLRSEIPLHLTGTLGSKAQLQLGQFSQLKVVTQYFFLLTSPHLARTFGCPRTHPLPPAALK